MFSQERARVVGGKGIKPPRLFNAKAMAAFKSGPTVSTDEMLRVHGLPPEKRRSTLQPAMTRLRQWLRKAMGLDRHIDPVSFEPESSSAPEGYRLRVEFGYVEYLDGGRLGFQSYWEPPLSWGSASP